MPTATNEWKFFPVQLGTMAIMILSYDFIARSDAAHVTCSTDTDSCVTCSIDTNSRMTYSKKYGFYKLHAAARLPH